MIITRFLVIVYPIRARSWCTLGKSRRAVALVWALAVLLAAPPAFNKVTFFLPFSFFLFELFTCSISYNTPPFFIPPITTYFSAPFP